MACPTSIVITSANIGMAYSTSIFGSTSMPTDTKNMAPKRSFTGATSFSILSASMVSDMIEPMTNAPKALLNPTFVDSTAIRQHSPSDTMSSVSSLMSLRTDLRTSGTTKIPTTNHSIRKNTIFTMLPIIWPPSAPLPTAMADSITIMTIASTSSSMSTLITGPVNCCCLRPMSLKALYMIVVELIASIPPRNMQSMRFQPNEWPTMMPRVIMQNIMVHVDMTGEMPIFIIFLNEKSSPSEKSRNITPMSAHVCMLDLSITDMV